VRPPGHNGPQRRTRRRAWTLCLGLVPSLVVLLSTGPLLWSMVLGTAPASHEPEPLDTFRRRLEAGDAERVAAELDRRLADLRRAAAAAPTPDPARRALMADLLDLRVEASWRSGDAHSPQALRRARRALSLRRELVGAAGPGRQTALLPSLDNLAILHAERGDYEDAERTFRRALAIRRQEMPGTAALGLGLYRLGNLYQLEGELPRARTVYEKALRVTRSAVGRDDVQVANILDALGVVERTLGHRDKARHLLRAALALRQRLQGPEHVDLAFSLYHLGELAVTGGEPRRARTLIKRALALDRKALGPRHPLVATDLQTLAVVEHELGHGARARRLLESALAIRRQALGPEHPLVAESSAYLAMLLVESGGRREGARDMARAEVLLSRALEILNASVGPNHRLTVESLTGLAALHWLEGRRHQALDEALEAEARGRHHFFHTARGLTRFEALHLRPAADASGLDIALTALAAAKETGDSPPVERIWSALIRSRGVVMDEMVRRRRAMHGNTPSEDHRNTAAGLDTVRRALAPGMALVAYTTFKRLIRPGMLGDGLTPGPRRRSETAYLALVLPPDSGPPRAIPLGPASAIEPLVAAWQEQVTVPDRDLSGGPGPSPALVRAGDALRRAVWDPLEPALAGADLVLVVPDGMLHRVSLATLPTDPDRGSGSATDPRRARYLVETAPPIHYLSTERDLIRHRERRPRSPQSHGLLVVGAPRLPPGTKIDGLCPGEPTRELPEIPGSSREVDDIAALWQHHRQRAESAGDDGWTEDVVRLTGPDAREEAVAAAAPGRRVIHLASHAFVRSKPCTGTEDEPLLASGLVLSPPPAGATEAPESEDGILHAEELAGLDLSGVEWVVLSACETGLGPVEGREGVLGLRRALEMSGAETLIMSLWTVQDAATREWMTALYRQRLAGASTAVAVQQASRQVIATRRRDGRSDHPFFWGAFVASGGWQ